MNSNGDFIISFVDFSTMDINTPDISAQLYNHSGIAQGNNFKINDIDGTFSFGFYYENYLSHSVDFDINGNFIFAWQDKRNGDRDIYLQCYNNLAIAEGNNFKVNDNIADSTNQLTPSMAIWDNGDFIICWGDERDGYSNIYEQTPNIAIGDDNAIICWADYRAYKTDIYAQCYDKLGNSQGLSFKVNDDIDNESQWRPSVDVDMNGNFIISWEDARDNEDEYDIYIQRYNNDISPLGTNFNILANNNKQQSLSDVILYDNKIYNTWTSNCLENTGYVVYLNVLDWDDPTEIFEINNREIGLPNKFTLEQNYPNPFNPTTSIKYQLAESSIVSLKIYSISGELVKTLINENQTAGNYMINWNGKNDIDKICPSGIYLYKLETNKGYSEIKRMILLK